MPTKTHVDNIAATSSHYAPKTYLAGGETKVVCNEENEQGMKYGFVLEHSRHVPISLFRCGYVLLNHEGRGK